MTMFRDAKVKPFAKFAGDDIISEKNLELLALAKTGRKLDKKTLKRLNAELKKLSNYLKKHRVDDTLSRYERLRDAFHRLSDALEAGIKDYQKKRDPALRPALDAMRIEIADLRRAGSDAHRQLAPHREAIQRYKFIEDALHQHQVAVDDDKIEKMLRAEMGKEAKLVGDIIASALSRLGMREIMRDENSEYVRNIRFEFCVATPDSLQYKILTGRRAMLGGYVNEMPKGVNAVDIVKDERVMQHLTAVLERDVWSPHLTDNVHMRNGAFLNVDRYGLRSGIETRVAYKAIMSRYDTTEPGRIALPGGLKAGKEINWVYLDSSQACHFLVTGITHSGKSTALRSFMTAITEHQSPKTVRYCIIDLKGLADYSEFKDAPHFIPFQQANPIANNTEEAWQLLERLYAELERRKKVIGNVARDLTGFNAKMPEYKRLPRIVILFDEFQNTRMKSFIKRAGRIDDIATLITQQGRAMGIHLWVGIQQPRTDNFPPRLRDNFTLQFVGHQASAGAAQSATGDRSSLQLEDIPGRMMCYSGWHSFKVQMPLVEDADVARAIQSARDKYGEIGTYELPRLPEILPKEETA